MGYLGSHRGNIISRIPTNIGNVKRGDVFTATYKSKIKNETKQSMWLVLDSIAIGAKIHCIDMEMVAPVNLTKLLKYTVEKQPIQETLNGRPYSRLRFDKGEREFYQNPIKVLMKLGFANSYRTMFRANFSAIQIINYEWTEKRTRGKSDE